MPIGCVEISLDSNAPGAELALQCSFFGGGAMVGRPSFEIAEYFIQPANKLGRNLCMSVKRLATRNGTYLVALAALRLAIGTCMVF